jgi:DNA-binding MarR family transcriptional regulator
MRKKPGEEVVRVWARLLKAHRIALGAVEQALKAAGLPPLAWYDALLELERAGERGLRPFELEREMLLEQYNLSRLIDRMAKAGCVERRVCQQDGRGHIIIIASGGRNIRRRMWRVYGAAIQHAVGDKLSASETRTLGMVLGALIERPTTR